MDTNVIFDIIIVGAGLTGATIAERCASQLGWKVCVIEKRDHIGGNVYDYVDVESGIRISKYGAHLFHTNDVGVWEYVNMFSKWRRWDHRVLSAVGDRLLPMPVNRNTVNGLFDIHLESDIEMEDWLKSNSIPCENPKNSRDVTLSRVGIQLYEKLFRPYTVKQWAKDPCDLDASVMARIPVRTNTDDRYFSDRYQALPENGYTSMVESMLDHPKIKVILGTSFEEVKDLRFTHLVYTGPIDAYFKKSGLPPLEYRSIDFQWERYESHGYFQPASVVNFPSMDVQYTRIVEYKHFLHQKSHQTIIAKEITTDQGEPYYPVPNKRNQELYLEYKKLAESTASNIHFIGRLASYKYFNMDQAIRCALDYFDQHFRIYSR